ncbi:MAG TPA: PKD domain-containing protein [Chitinophagales bacterium]|nr:PKD domain-containing protein [Chitinophagales bacterium]
METISRVALAFIILLNVNGQAQQSVNSWTANPFEQRVFVENKGQFDASTGVSQPILFQAQSGGINIYFSRQGIVYRYDEVTENSEEDSEEKEARKINMKPLSLTMQWVGSNPSVEVIAQEQVSFYYTYSYDSKNQQQGVTANAYKKIIYQNLYPGIDVEYIMPEDKEGIEYSLIIHPGADVRAVKMLWDGKDLSQDASGNVIIGSAMGNFTDHSPDSFYSDGDPIASSFAIRENTISFSLGKYDKSREIIIDPWVINPNLTDDNKAYDINYDFNGNVYVYGGSNPLKLAKFNSSGSLQWIFNTSIFFFLDYYGDFTVDAVTGTCYIGEAIFFPAARVLKVNSSGVQSGIWSGSTTMTEIWRMDYNYCNGTIICGGGGTVFPLSQAFILDTTMTNITLVDVANATSCCVDVALLSTDPYTHNCFMLFSEVQATNLPSNNLLVKCPMPSLIPTAWGTQTNHLFREGLNANYIGLTGGLTNGFNGIAVSPNFVYTYDGRRIKKWSKSNGAFVDSSLSVSNSLFDFGGLAVDECENLYVGVQSSVQVFDSLHALINTFTLPDTVYDLRISGDKLYACGNTFVTSIDLAGTPMLQMTLSSTPATCSGCNGTTTVNVASCSSNTNFTYLWTPGNQTTQTATGLCPGTYTVRIFANCKPTIDDTITVHSTDSMAALFSASSACAGSTTIFTDQTTYAPGDTISWLWNFGDGSIDTMHNPQHTYSTAGNYNVTLTITSTAGCTGSITKSVIVNPGFNISFSTVSSSCFAPTGQVSVTTMGGSAPFNFQWSPVSSMASSISSLSPGTYTVTVTDTNGCTVIDSVSVGVSNSLALNIGNDTVLCQSSALQLSANISATSFLWSTGETTQSISVTQPGMYWLIALSLLCSDTDSIVITIPAEIQLGNNYSLCDGEEIILSAGNYPGASYNWSTGELSQSITINQPGTYWVNVFFKSCLLADTVEILGDGGSTVYIPNAFSPNGDGVNEKLLPISQNISAYHFSIFSRWGELIFETTDSSKGWDGTNKGIAAAMGVYVYVVSYISDCNNIKKEKVKCGNVSLIR